MDTVENTPQAHDNLPEQTISQIRDDSAFQHGLHDITQQAEALRLHHMKARSARVMTSTTLSLLIITAGSGGFGWLLLMESDIAKALACITLALLVPLLLNLWSRAPLANYKTAYKRKFLPQLAQLFGNFKYHPKRGIGRKVLNHTGVIPAHDDYRAEDCFMGRYKGVKIIFSEAELFRKSSKTPFFRGLFVLLEAQKPCFKGHTILTSDHALIERYQHSRWQTLQRFNVDLTDSALQQRFQMFSSKPSVAQDFMTEALIKELAEASDVFENAPITATFMKEKYIFIMLPTMTDMFEPSPLHMPVTTSQHTKACKKEISKIIEIIDVTEMLQK